MMAGTFRELAQFFIKRRNLSVEQLANLANLSRKTLYRWVNGEVANPRHWYQIVALGKALRLNIEEVNQLLEATKNPSFHELRELARHEYEVELLEEFSKLDPVSVPIPRPQVRFEPWAALEAPAGAMRPQSPFYIERLADSQLRHQLAGLGTTTTIQAGRQTGKTSLLTHTINAYQGEQSKIIYLDFHLVDEASGNNLTSFLRFLSEAIAEQLDLEWEVVDRYWQTARNPAQTFNRFLQQEMLKPCEHSVLLAIDEADLLLGAEYKKHFFALLRAWDSRRAFDADWRKLNLVMVISTHPYLLIDDVNLSPFNVGLNIQLKDFSPDQIADLNQRHGSPLKRDEISDLIALVGGHPYLVRQAYYTLVSESLSLTDLLRIAYSPDGPFGKHLLFYRHSLKKNPTLFSAFQQLLREQKMPDESLLERLDAVGLVQQENGKWRARCGLYGEFFKRQMD
ncbi:MAG TPA: AAA-like domain-containing protein [Anaerolineales bacterium]|nr:AAA-like domain-containing protein [Anaerolineales bacterium]